MTRVVSTLPKPRFAAIGLENWISAVVAPLPLPPGPREGWTCLFSLLGPELVLFAGDRGYDRIADSAVLRALLTALGRPVDATEQDALLLATPVPAGIDLVSLFSGLVRADEYQVRQRACLALGVLGDERSGPVIAARLDDDDNDVRRGAAEALGRLGAKKFAVELARRPWDSDSSVSAARLEAIERLGAWDEVAELLHRGASDDVGELVDALIAATQQDDATGLEEFLTNTDRDLQRVAARMFAGRPELAARALESLLSRLREGGDEAVQVWCAEAVGAVGEDALESLVELLGEDGWEARALACIALGVDPRLAGSAVDELRARLEDGDDDVTREASLALLIGGAADFRAEELVQSAMGVNRYRFSQRAAARFREHPLLATAGMLYGETPATVEQLLPCLDNNRLEPQIRAVCAYLLALHAPELAAPLLERLARDDARNLTVEVRRAAAAALLITGEAPTFLPALHRLLLFHSGETQTRGVGRTEGLDRVADQLATLAAKDGDWPLRLEALRLLQSLGAEAQRPYLTLIAYAARHDPDKDVRDYASTLMSRTWRSTSVGELLANTLVAAHGTSGEEGRTAAFRELATRDPDLGGRLARHFFRSEDRHLARAAAEILGSTAAPDEVASLVGLGVARLDDSNWIPREAACVLLGHLRLSEGLLDEVAESLRVRAADDSDNDVREAANAALGRLGMPPVEPDEEEEDSEDEE